MHKKSGLKSSILLFISTLFVQMATAVETPWGRFQIGNWLESSATSVAGSLFWYEVQTVPDALMFIALLGAIYFIELKFIHLIFTTIQGRINLGSSDRFSVSGMGGDEIGRSEKGIALTTAYITTNFAGPLGIYALFGAGLLAGLMYTLAYLNIFNMFNAGGGELTRDTGDDSGGSVGAMVAEVDDALDDAEEHEDRAEGEEESGDGEGAAQDLEAALQDFNVAEEDIQAMLSTEHEQVRETLNHLKQTLNVEEEEENVIQQIEQFIQKFENDLQNLQNGAPQVDDLTAHLTGSYGGAYDGSDMSLSKIQDDINNMQQAIQHLGELVREEESEEEEEIRELEQELEEFAKTHRLVQRLKRDLGISHREEEQLQQVAQHLGGKLAQEAEQEANQEQQLEQRLQQLLREEEQVEEDLRTAQDVIAKIEQIDAQELQQLKGEFEQDGRLGQAFQQFTEFLVNEYGEGQVPDEIGERIDAIDREMTEVGNEIHSLAQEMENEGTGLEELRRHIDSVLSEVEG